MFIKFSLMALLFSLTLFATPLKTLSSYQADFKQTIIDQDDVKVVYSGTFIAKKPLHAKWIYQNPVEKSLYINNRQIVLVEPELEQAIYRESDENFSLFNLLKDAKEIKKGIFVKLIGEKIYRLQAEGNIIKKIRYKDNFDNNVEIVFSNQKPDVALKTKDFHPKIPEDFDILHE